MEGDIVKILIVVGYLIYWISRKFLNKAGKKSAGEKSSPGRKSAWDEFKDQLKEEMKKAREQLEGEQERPAGRQPARTSAKPSEPRKDPAIKRPQPAQKAAPHLEATLEEYIAQKEKNRESLSKKYNEERFEKGLSPQQTGTIETVSAFAAEEKAQKQAPPSELDAIGGGPSSADRFNVYSDVYSDVYGDIHSDIHSDVHAEHDRKNAHAEKGTGEIHDGSAGIVDSLRKKYSDDQLMLIMAEVMAPYGESPHSPQ